VAAWPHRWQQGGQLHRRLLPQKGTDGHKKCVDALRHLDASELDSFAKGLGFVSAKSFCTAMGKQGYSRVELYASGLDPVVLDLDAEVRLQAAEAAARTWRSKFMLAKKRLAVDSEFSDVVQTVANMVPSLTVISPEPRPMLDEKVGRGRETDVLQLSDLHAGEVVSAKETMGINAYDMDIMNRRLDMLFQKTLELVEIRRTSLYIPNLIIAEEGDMLSGDIHDELSITNVENMMLLAVRTAYMLSQGIAYLSPHFETIDVPCVVGNHPRLTKKPSFKQRYYNWDYLCYQWQAIFCKGLENVTFHIPKAPYHLINAENTRLLLFHGDAIKGWMGVPYYGIDRCLLRLRQMFASVDDYFDSALIGHFHCADTGDTATGPRIINGSVKGGDEFAMGSLQMTNKPSQNLVYYHEKHGYIGGSPIYLQSADADESYGFEMILPEVWADVEDELE